MYFIQIENKIINLDLIVSATISPNGAVMVHYLLPNINIDRPFATVEYIGERASLLWKALERRIVF